MAQLSFRNIFLGLVSGLISGTVCLILAYLVGVAAIAYYLRDLLATLLAALTVLPLMLIFVVLLPTIVIGVILGLLSGTVFSLMSRAVSLPAAAILGLALAEIILAIALPMIAPPSDGDFLSIAGNPNLAGIYGLILGVITDCLFRWVSRR